jgi:hypothetical protein
MLLPCYLLKVTMHTIEFDDVQKFAESKAKKRNLM